MAGRFAIIPAHAFDLLPKLSGVEVKVLVALAGRMGDDGCFPSIITIGKDCGIERERTVQNAVSALAAYALISREHRSGRSTIYRWTPPAKSVGGTQSAGGTESAPTPPAKNAPHNNTKEQYQEQHQTVGAKESQESRELPAQSKPSTKVAAIDCQAAALRILSAYPKRSGDTGKAKAAQRIAALLSKGTASEVDLLKAVENYAAHCDAEGKTGGAYVKQASTFFGSCECWREWQAIEAAPAEAGFAYSPQQEAAFAAMEDRLAAENASKAASCNPIGAA